ncbi:nuclear transport factor 2 family protein [Brevundimonas lenta]|uniref:Ketosteroid isomerase-like protein n=1 Tax=Brevundimonas lenta TaxID=424796 RepID=A0A7W6JEF4_9CAUL|nr:nuclear transport factor 2 family protein [Brevundimonas lenta]MBB4082648.1 ketosteroid isomerase-like protein [Brevundimonas lenta]
MPIIALLAALALQTPGVVIPAEPALTEAIAARDAAIFSVMFDQCDPPALADLVTDDLEFYHDRGGAMFTRRTFVEDYDRNCNARKAPDSWRSRRELVPGTLKVYAIPDYGAVAEGTHQFYERQGDGPEALAGRARFSVLWKLEPDGQWRMARAFSIDHAAASE